MYILGLNALIFYINMHYGVFCRILRYSQIKTAEYAFFQGGNNLIGDLHCHTRLSNGTLSVDELIELAKSKGVDAIAVTDHECLAGSVRAEIIGNRSGIKVVSGVEISAVDADGNIIHILCYLPAFPDRLEGLFSKHNEARKMATTFMHSRLKKRYPSVSLDFVKRCASGAISLFHQHFMNALIEHGETDSYYGDLYRELFDPASENSILFKPRFSCVADVLSAIRDADGIAILAHPAKYGDSEKAIEYLKMGFDGVEVWHPTASQDMSAKLLAYCKKNGLLATGGSGFHGAYNDGVFSLGSSVTPEAQLKELLGYKAKQKRLQKKKLAEEEKQKEEDKQKDEDNGKDE